MLNHLVFLVVGFVLLVNGAEWLIRGASSIAKSFGISSLVIGLTVVAFGTSAPELFVSVRAALDGSADVAIGNVIGSNIFNILVIIGLSALIRPIIPEKAILFREMPIMLVVLGLFWFVSLDGLVSRLEGGILFSGIIFYLVLSYLLSRRKTVLRALEEERDKESQNDSHPSEGKLKSLMLIVFGLMAMVFGSEWIVEAAKFIARQFHVSELVISVSLVAIGTSLPELATTIIAAKNGESELALGNAIGSNIFNVLSVIGLSALIVPITVSSEALRFDYWIMFFGCFAAWPLMYIGRRLSRIDGGILVGMYLTYLVLLVTLDRVSV